MELVLVETELQNEAATRLRAQCRDESGPDPFSSDNRMSWLVYHNGQVVGLTEAYGFDWPSRRCRGSCYVLPGHRGNGVGMSAVAARNQVLFNEYNIRKIEASVAVANGAANRMDEKLGAVKEGCLKDSGYRDGAYISHNLYAWFRKE